MEWCYNDGGRSKYYKTVSAGDCFLRSVAIANFMDYKDAYLFIKNEIGFAPINGVAMQNAKKVLNKLGWKWVPTFKRYSGETIYLSDLKNKNDIIICSMRNHITTVIDGRIYDTFNCEETNNKCVYGYWIKEN